jgi:hypothetical protein
MIVTVICRECGAKRTVAGFLADSDVIRCNDCRSEIGLWFELKELAQTDKTRAIKLIPDSRVTEYADLCLFRMFYNACPIGSHKKVRNGTFRFLGNQPALEHFIGDGGRDLVDEHCAHLCVVVKKLHDL